MRPELQNLDAATVMLYVDGMHWPATKHQLLEYAEDRGAPDEVLIGMDAFSDRRYESMDDVVLGLDQAKMASRGY